MKLTIYYDQQYWVGVVEEVSDTKLKAVRYIFGPKPQDWQVLDFVNGVMLNLLSQASPLVEVVRPTERKINPKRLAREAAKEVSQKGVGTAVQQALQLQLESRKKEKHVVTRQQKEAIKEQKREIARKKAKAKHRGK